jgi:hypothetical protein
VAEAVVWGMEKIVPGKQDWGERHKGLFNLGYTAESVTRTPSWTNRSDDEFAFGREYPPAVTIADALDDSFAPLRGLVHVDASEVLGRHSWTGLDLDHPLVDFTVGWLDPVGSHAGYHRPEIYRLIRRVLTDSSSR